jgi:hypothetical protein
MWEGGREGEKKRWAALTLQSSTRTVSFYGMHFYDLLVSWRCSLASDRTDDGPPLDGARVIERRFVALWELRPRVPQNNKTSFVVTDVVVVVVTGPSFGTFWDCNSDGGDDDSDEN